MSFKLTPIINKVTATSLLLFTSTFSLVAQIHEREIKLTGKYYWGTGFGEDRESSINYAKKDLIERLLVRINSNTIFIEEDTIDDYKVELTTKTTSKTTMQLRGLNYLPAKKRRDNTWETIAYIKIEDFNKTIESEQQRLSTALKLALDNENQGRFDAAIPQYMHILASTFYFPVPFFTNLEDDSLEIRSFLLSKMKNWVLTSDISISKVRSMSTSNNTELYFDLEVQYRQMPTSFLQIRISKQGYINNLISNGKTTVFYDLPPEDLIRSYSFILSPVIPNTIASENIELLNDILPTREVTLDIDFSEVIDINFEAIKSTDETFLFNPKIKNLSVYSLKWDFGDGSISYESTPTHTFEKDFTTSTVTLTLNGTESLIKKRTLSSLGTLSDDIAGNTNLDLHTDAHLVLAETDIVSPKFEIPLQHKKYIQTFLEARNADRLTIYLNELAKRKVIQLGRKSDVKDASLSYLVIVNPQTNQIIAYLSPLIEGKRFNLVTHEVIMEETLSKKFKGLGSIWFQFN